MMTGKQNITNYINKAFAERSHCELAKQIH